MQTKDKVQGAGNGQASQMKPAEQAALLRAKESPPMKEPARKPGVDDPRREQSERDASSH